MAGQVRYYRRYRGRQHLGVGQVERPAGRIQPDVGDADLDDVSAQVAAHRPGLDQCRVTDVDRPGEQQDRAREHVGEALLRRDADQDRGECAAVPSDPPFCEVCCIKSTRAAGKSKPMTAVVA